MKLALGLVLVGGLAFNSAAGVFTDFLKRMDESELTASVTNTLNLRFTILPTWGNPVSVRIQQGAAGFRLTAKRLDGEAGYKVGKLVESKERVLSKHESEELFEAFSKLKFFKLEASKPDENGLDGEEWLLEGLQGGKLHKVERWSADYEMRQRGLKDFVNFCGLMVRLADLQEPPKNKGHVIFGRKK